MKVHATSSKCGVGVSEAAVDTGGSVALYWLGRLSLYVRITWCLAKAERISGFESTRAQHITADMPMIDQVVLEAGWRPDFGAAKPWLSLDAMRH